MGSSYYAPKAGGIYLSRRGLFNCVKEASELLHYGMDAFPPEYTLVPVSQSGESIETREVLQALSGRSQVIGVTNDEQSTIGRLSQVVLPILAGEETCASTKTYVTTVLVLYLLALRWQGERLEDHAAELKATFSALQGVIQTALDRSAETSAFLRNATKLTLIGRGPVLASVLHGALILKETSGTLAEAMNGGAFRHGPLELAGDGHAAIIAAPKGVTQQFGVALAQELAAYGSRVLLLTDATVDERENLRVLKMPAVSEELAPLTYIAPLEVLAWQVATDLGADPNSPQYISKVTTRE
jgi:glucosamine--fructose-6-phosphate aminotransferase (isomerizing)